MLIEKAMEKRRQQKWSLDVCTPACRLCIALSTELLRECLKLIAPLVLNARLPLQLYDQTLEHVCCEFLKRDRVHNLMVSSEHVLVCSADKISDYELRLVVQSAPSQHQQEA